MKFSLSLSAFLLWSAALACAQSTPAPPPIKMGLWQSSVTVDMSNMPGMAQGSGGSMTHVNQSCMTPDSWRDAFRSMQQRRQQANANCTTSNFTQDSHQMTLDMACSSQQGFNSKIHVKMFLDSEEAMHGTASVNISAPAGMGAPNAPQGAMPQNMAITSTIKSKFISSDCGDVKPGESKPVQQ
jgi:hypothetical protein